MVLPCIAQNTRKATQLSFRLWLVPPTAVVGSGTSKFDTHRTLPKMQPSYHWVKVRSLETHFLCLLSFLKLIVTILLTF